MAGDQARPSNVPVAAGRMRGLASGTPQVPFRYHHTFCPYLVGDHDEVAQAVTTYLNGGIRTFVLAIPQEPDDLWHARIAIERAVEAMDR
jgi:hypothetical protein